MRWVRHWPKPASASRSRIFWGQGFGFLDFWEPGFGFGFVVFKGFGFVSLQMSTTNSLASASAS